MDKYISSEELETSLSHIENSPHETGTVELIVCRPATNERFELNSAELSVDDGLVGDNWKHRDESYDEQGLNPDTQLTLINARLMAAIEADKGRWKLAGDQFYVDFDLSEKNTPPGTRLQIGSAIIEVTEEPHLACGKFAARFGKDAARLVNSTRGKKLNLRGINAKVILPGVVPAGTCISKLKA